MQYLEVEEEVGEHRLYDGEIIELGPEISLILVLPGQEKVCSVNETSMAVNLNRADLALVPLQSWEVLQLSTYHRKLLAIYAKEPSSNIAAVNGVGNQYSNISFHTTEKLFLYAIFISELRKTGIVLHEVAHLTSEVTAPH